MRHRIVIGLSPSPITSSPVFFRLQWRKWRRQKKHQINKFQKRRKGGRRRKKMWMWILARATRWVLTRFFSEWLRQTTRKRRRHICRGRRHIRRRRRRRHVRGWFWQVGVCYVFSKPGAALATDQGVSDLDHRRRHRNRIEKGEGEVRLLVELTET